MKRKSPRPRTVVDAIVAIAVTILKVDWNFAVRGDPFRCLFSRAITRALRARQAWTGRGVVLVWMQDGSVIRYALDKAGKVLVRQYDRGESIARDETFWLCVPPAKRPRGNGSKSSPKGGTVRTPEQIKARYANRMKDPKASLDRNSSCILFEDGTKVNL